MPSVYVTGRNGIVATSSEPHHPARRRHDDRLGCAADELRHRRQARRLRAEARRDSGAAGASRRAFDKALSVRDVLKKAIKPGVRADETMKTMDEALQRRRLRRHRVQQAQQGRQDRRRLRLPSRRQHRPRHRAVADHMAAAAEHVRACKRSTSSRSSTSPTRRSPEWGGAKLRIPIEDDAMLTEDGIQFVHPSNYRLLIIK